MGAFGANPCRKLPPVLPVGWPNMPTELFGTLELLKELLLDVLAVLLYELPWFAVVLRLLKMLGAWLWAGLELNMFVP